MTQLEKILRMFAPKTISSIERNSIDTYFWEATRHNKSPNIIRVYHGEYADYRIKITKER